MLSGFEVEGEPPQPGTKIRANDKDVGEITSAARLPFATGERDRWRWVTFAAKSATPGTAVQIGEQNATVKSLPFEF